MQDSNLKLIKLSKTTLENNKKVINEKLLFIALYFFILFFFILLTYVAFAPDPTKQIEKLFTSTNSTQVLASDPSKLSLNAKAPALYYSPQLKTYLPVEPSTFLQPSLSIFEHDFTWEQSFDKKGQVTHELKEFIEILRVHSKNNYIISLNIFCLTSGSYPQIANLLRLIEFEKSFKIKIIPSDHNSISIKILKA